MSENGFMFMPIIFESLGNTLLEVRSFMFEIYKNYYSDRGESNGESTMNNECREKGKILVYYYLVNYLSIFLVFCCFLKYCIESNTGSVH